MKDYYKIITTNGYCVQAIDIIKEVLGEEGYIIFCITNAFKYISRMGKKEGEDVEKEQKKIFEYLTWCHEVSDEITMKYIEKYKKITSLGDALEEYYKNVVKYLVRGITPTEQEIDAMIDEELDKYKKQKALENNDK